MDFQQPSPNVTPGTVLSYDVYVHSTSDLTQNHYSFNATAGGGALTVTSPGPPRLVWRRLAIVGDRDGFGRHGEGSGYTYTNALRLMRFVCCSEPRPRLMTAVWTATGS